MNTVHSAQVLVFILAVIRQTHSGANGIRQSPWIQVANSLVYTLYMHVTKHRMMQIAMHNYIHTEIGTWIHTRSVKVKSNIIWQEGDSVYWGQGKSSLWNWQRLRFGSWVEAIQQRQRIVCSRGRRRGSSWSRTVWRMEHWAPLCLLPRWCCFSGAFPAASYSWSLQIWKSPWTSSHLCPHSFLFWSHQTSGFKYHSCVLIISSEYSSLPQTYSSPTACLTSQHGYLINMPDFPF